MANNDKNKDHEIPKEDQIENLSDKLDQNLSLTTAREAARVQWTEEEVKELHTIFADVISGEWKTLAERIRESNLLKDRGLTKEQREGNVRRQIEKEKQAKKKKITCSLESQTTDSPKEE